MLETKEQKEVFAGVVILVVILLAVTVFSHPKYAFKDTKDYNQPDQNILQSKAYLDYLASQKVDTAASKELFQKIVTQQDIAKEVNAALATDQKITPPPVDASSLNVTKVSGQQAVTDYLTNSVGPVVTFNQNVQTLSKNLFGGDANTPDAVKSQVTGLQAQLQKVETPEEALPLQTSLLSILASYKNLAQVAVNYNNQQDQNPWPQVYQDYAAINQSAADYNTTYKKLISKYKISDSAVLHYAAKPANDGFSLIPKAQAFLGLGDVTITIGDIPALIMDSIKQGLVSSFTTFMATFLDKVITKIESNYAIANFLYYSDALVNGQYADDYLNKYVSDSMDRNIIKQFIPQFSCGSQNNAALQTFFQAKASQYLGFDPSNLNPNDPNYYQKLASVGNFLATPQGWDLYYQDMAAQAESASQQAVDRELSSNGLKSPRNTVSDAISASVNDIASGEAASFNAIMQLGINNASDFISSFVATVTQNLVNKFVFNGAVQNNGGQIAVLKEQTTCLAAAQLQVVLPVSNTQYMAPPPPPSSSDLLDQACASLPRGCNTATSTVP